MLKDTELKDTELKDTETLMKYTGLEDVDEALLKDTDCHRHQSHIHELG